MRLFIFTHIISNSDIKRKESDIMDEIYTLRDVADKLKISVQSVTKEVKSGRLRSILVGRQYRISETFLHEYVNGIFGNVAIKQTRKINSSKQVSKVANVNKTAIKVAPVAELNPIVHMDKIDTNSEPVAVSAIEVILDLKEKRLTWQEIAVELNKRGLRTAFKKEWNEKNASKCWQRHEKTAKA